MAKRKVNSKTTRKALSRIAIGDKIAISETPIIRPKMTKIKVKTTEQLRTELYKQRKAEISKVRKASIEETIFKMTESANELFDQGYQGSAKRLFRIIDSLCDNNDIDIPDEAVSLNIALDEHFGYDVLLHPSR